MKFYNKIEYLENGTSDKRGSIGGRSYIFNYISARIIQIRSKYDSLCLIFTEINLGTKHVGITEAVAV